MDYQSIFMDGFTGLMVILTGGYLILLDSQVKHLQEVTKRQDAKLAELQTRLKLHEEFFDAGDGLEGFHSECDARIGELEKFAAAVKTPRIVNQTTYRCVPND